MTRDQQSGGSSTTTNDEAAVEAGCAALRDWDTGGTGNDWLTDEMDEEDRVSYRRAVRRVLAAALPFVEARVRQQLAAEIEAKAKWYQERYKPYDAVSAGREQGAHNAFRLAARVVRGDQENRNEN